MVRDTALTPTHIPMFYFFFRLSVVLAFGDYLYGTFRIPAVYSFDKSFPWWLAGDAWLLDRAVDWPLPRGMANRQTLDPPQPAYITPVVPGPVFASLDRTVNGQPDFGSIFIYKGNIYHFIW